MAIVLRIPCSGEEHTMTWDGTRLRFDPAEHDFDLEWGLMEMGGELSMCMTLHDGMAAVSEDTGLPWTDILETLAHAELITVDDIARLAVDFAQRVVEALEYSGVEYSDYVPSDVPFELTSFLDGTAEIDVLPELHHAISVRVNKMEAQIHRGEEQAAILEELDDEEWKVVQAKVDQLRADIEGSICLYQAIKCARTKDLYDAADDAAETAHYASAAKSAALNVSEGERESVYQKERLWQLDRTVKVIAAKQQGKPWPPL